MLTTVTALALMAWFVGCSLIRNCPKDDAGKTARDYAGLWTYPGTMVWIKVLPDGRAFQCRIAGEGSVLRSEGVFRNGQIEWQRLWGTETITRQQATITLCGRFGTHTYTQARGEMDAQCQSPF